MMVAYWQTFSSKLLNDSKNVYIINIQLYYLKLPIINFKLPNAKLYEVLFQEVQERNKNSFFNSDNEEA